MTSFTHGMNLNEIRDLARQMDAAASSIETMRGNADRLVGDAQFHWSGNDSRRFQDEWENVHRGAVTRIVEQLRQYAGKMRQSADDQEQASNTYRSGGAGTGSAASGNVAGSQPLVTFSSTTPASPDAIKTLRMHLTTMEATHIKDRMPGTYKAIEDLAHQALESDPPSQAQIEAADRLYFLAMAANINRSTVADTAQLAVDSLADADESRLSAIASGVGLLVPGDRESSLTKNLIPRVGDQIMEGQVESAGEYGISALIGAVRDRNPDQLVAYYDQSADNYISSLAAGVDSGTEFHKGLAASSIMANEIQVYGGRLEELRIQDDAAASTSIMTGPDSGIAKMAWDGLKFVPVVNVALGGSELIGGLAHGSMVEQNGQAALQLATVDSMSSLRSMALGMQLDE